MHPSENLRPSYGRRERGVAGHDGDSGPDSSNQRVWPAPHDAEYVDSPPVAPPSYAFGRMKHRANSQPSLGRRTLRAIGRFCFAVLLGVGATLSLQAYSEEAKDMVRTWVPFVDWLLPASTVASAATATDQPDMAQQLKSMSVELAVMRRGMEQIAAKHDLLAANQTQMVQNITAMQEIERDISQKISSVLSPPTAHVAPHKPPPALPAPSPGAQPSTR